jgi:hypothetical protein
VTHDEAMAEAKRQQQLHPDAKWIATRQGTEWTVARIALAPNTNEQTRTATKPPPNAPRDDPYSQLENITRNYGGYS